MKVHLGVHKQLLGSIVDSMGGVVAEIVPAMQSYGSKLSQIPIIRTMLPVSGSGVTKAIDLPDDARAGSLLVSVRMPSGELLTQELTPQDMSQAAEPTLILQGEPSPHEWLSWATMLSERPVRAKERVPSDHAAQLEPRFLMAADGQLIDAQLNGHPDFDPVLGLKSLLVSVPGLEPRTQRRFYLRLTEPGSELRHLVVIPGPWLDTWGRNMTVQVLFSSGWQDGQIATTVRVLVQDTLTAPMLGYLESGDRQSASEFKPLAEQGERLLNDKYQNPLAAAAGGYLLLAAQDIARLHSWPANLARDFTWLPDGCVIAGHQCLQSKDRRSKIHEAAEYLLEAAKRGVPVYTMGLRMLADGLRLLSASSRLKHEERINRAAEWANDLASSAQPGSIFTVIDGDKSTERAAAFGFESEYAGV